ncbi:pilus assembly protein [Panacagrimonas sp.]|uniref:pilus assembly protein n=1 Tax=Panacagrimonas sp. TaxID=2480088 RepID=UPI003B52C6A2
MKTRRRWLTFACAGAMALPCALQADDTDIYINGGAGGSSPPMVMFSLDYRSNLTSTQCSNASAASCVQAQYFRANGLADDVNLIGSGKFYFFDTLRLALKLALQKTREKLLESGNPDAGLRVGLMMSHNNVGVPNRAADIPNCADCSNGGAILRGFRDILAEEDALEEFNTTLARLRQLKDGGNAPDHAYQGAEMYFELFRYLTGQGVYNGHNGWRDFESGNSVDTSSNMNAYKPASLSISPHTWPDGRIENAAQTAYVSPLTAEEECTQVFAVNFFFGNSNQDSDSNTAINAARSAGGMGPGTAGSNDAYLRTVEFLRGNDLGNGAFGTAAEVSGDQNVTSYFFFNGQGTNSVTALADAGGTTPRLASDDPGALVLDLTNLFDEILSVSTTFVAASIPANVFNRAGVVDNVYIALFQADEEGRPFWPGNVKKLKIGGDANNPILIDATGASAVQDSDGRIRANALTFWTDTADPRLATADDNDTPEDASDDTPANKDGRRVPRGGAGHKIPGYISGSPGLSNADTGARQLFYLSGSTLSPLNATAANATALQTALKAADSAEALDLLEFLRGLDPASGSVRNWIMGDALHSRPLPINYGAASFSGVGSFSITNPAIYIAVGSNDGYMRLIQNTTAGGAESGREVWAFMPPEGMASRRAAPNDFANQKLLFGNNAGSTPRHPYTVDGAPVSFVIDNNVDGTIAGADRVWLYFGLRRGGLSYYALDVTNPHSPAFKWKIDNTDADFTELGLSFSTPKTGYVFASGNRVPALVFAGGYDDNKDRRDGVGTDDNEGRAIYVVNADTGALIWKAVGGGSTGPSGDARVFRHADLLDSIPSDVSAVDTDGDDVLDRIIVGDSGGNIWRADLVGSDTADWKLSLLARLGRHAGSGKADDRRFFHEPDIVQTKDANGAYDAVLIESGDREDPLDGGGVAENWLYMIRDNAIGVGSALDRDTVHDDLTDITTVNCAADSIPEACGNLTNGWRIALQAIGEKGLSAPLTFNNVVFFTTYVPQSAAGTCAPSEGVGNLYAVRLSDGAPVFREFDSDSGDLDLDDRVQRLASAGIPAQVVYVPGPSDRTILRPDLKFGDAPGSNRFRGFWRRGESPPRDAP